MLSPLRGTLAFPHAFIYLVASAHPLGFSSRYFLRKGCSLPLHTHTHPYPSTFPIAHSLGEFPYYLFSQGHIPFLWHNYHSLYIYIFYHDYLLNSCLSIHFTSTMEEGLPSFSALPRLQALAQGLGTWEHSITIWGVQQ